MKFNIAGFRELFKDFPLCSQREGANPLFLAGFYTADKLNIWVVAEYNHDERALYGVWLTKEPKDEGYALDPFDFPVSELEKWVKEHTADVQVIRDSKFQPTRWFDLEDLENVTPETAERIGKRG